MHLSNITSARADSRSPEAPSTPEGPTPVPPPDDGVDLVARRTTVDCGPGGRPLVVVDGGTVTIYCGSPYVFLPD